MPTRLKLWLMRRGRRVQVFEPYVALPAVRIVDENVGGTTGQRSADGSVRVGGHQESRPAILGTPSRRLVASRDAAQPFHVDRDVHLTFRPARD